MGQFRRARNFGFLHPNSRLVKLVQLIKQVVVPPPKARPVVSCTCCGKLRVIDVLTGSGHLSAPGSVVIQQSRGPP